MKQILTDIIESFAKKEIIFSNEEQLQFQMAIELGKNGADVSLEVLSMENNEKMYTDIVVKNRDDTSYTAIELKYKLQDNDLIYTTQNGNKHPTFKQGANNLGRYAYLQDVERLERLIYDRTNIKNDPTHEHIAFNTFKFDKNKNKKVTKGYAIIISNDENYWKHIDLNRLSSNFSLEHQSVLKSGCHGWKIKVDSNDIWVSGNTAKGKYETIVNVNNPTDRDKYMAQKSNKNNLDYVILDNEYHCDWKDYTPNIKSCQEYHTENSWNKNFNFKYLILEILENKNEK